VSDLKKSHSTVLHFDKNQIDSNPGFSTQELLKYPHSFTTPNRQTRVHM